MAHPGTLHAYTPKLVAFEHTPANRSAPTDNNTNTILWIAGLVDGLLTVRYPATLASCLPPTWTLAEVLLSSSYNGWATGSLKRDARQLGDCVAYFKKIRPGGKIVLMGNSTGCQDIMEYLVGEGHEARTSVEGAILHSNVSDREAWAAMSEGDAGMKKQLDELLAAAEKLIKDGKEKEILPREGNLLVKELGAPTTAYRAYSLLAPGGDDDYFSSDLEDAVLERSFGRIPASCPVMFLWGAEDPFVPPAIDKEGLLGRWGEAVRKGGGVVDEVNGGVIKGAEHTLNDNSADVVQDLVGRVVGFVKGLEGGASRL